jgi:hypothetical protein
MFREMRLENISELKRLKDARNRVVFGSLTWGSGSRRTDCTAEYRSDLNRRIAELLWLNRTIRNVWAQ